MTKVTVNAQRFDPYKNFKFQVFWEGSSKPVASISKVGGLTRSTEVVEHREGGDPSISRESSGRTKYEAITLERGVTHDSDFEKWANRVWNYGSGLGAEVSLKYFRRNVLIGVVAGTYLVRVQVDGAECPLGSNEKGQFDSPSLTIP